MQVLEKLIQYCQIDTQSDPKNEQETPSTKKQFDLAHVLVEQLQAYGAKEVVCDEHCYVYAKLPSNLDHEVDTIGFIAHMDTAPDFSGSHVLPRVIEHYDGKDIVLNPQVVLKVEDFPWFTQYQGKTLLVTSGDTLLGADDKAGIAAIMEVVQYYHLHPEVAHGPISICFTPDEEIGNGPKYFDVEKFGAKYAYTMDGGSVYGIANETFNAASAKITIHGRSIHPGGAKNKMINAIGVACQLQTLLPEAMTPEHTEGHEGFIHLHQMEGNIEEANMEYIIRDHDRQQFEKKKELIGLAVDFINQKYQKPIAQVTLQDTYYNMKEVLDAYPEAMDTAFKAFQQMGIKPQLEAIRGGTDGAQLSFKGLPCPNLGCGGGNFHGRFEYCVIEELELSVQLIQKIVEVVSK